MEKLEELFLKNKYLVLVVFLGLILVGLGILSVRNGHGLNSDRIEVLTASTEAQDASGEVVAEISGAVEKSGVYRLAKDSRVEDGLIAAGGLSENADRDWVDKNLNRAAKLSDGQKIFIPEKGGGVVQSGLININTADLKTLDTLPGIGPVYAQNITEHRPYSSVEELVSKGAITSSVFGKIKNLVTVY